MSKQVVPNSRIAKKELIVTRTKSAQQRRQLRDIDRSMTKITQLLKSPTNKVYKNIKKKPKTPEKKSPKEKRESMGNSTLNQELYKEYYPDKLRRKFEEKRIFLKPKYESQTIVKLNKRKLGTPQRGVTAEDTNTSGQFDPDWSPIRDKCDVFSNLSMGEVVRLVEETESLDDEDLMEILTCPSPVWWEDPPDENYIEDAIFTRKSETTQETPTNPKKSRKEKGKGLSKTEKKKSKISDTAYANKNIVTITKTDDKFIKKCNKLENILGNIKNKTTIESKTVTDKSEHLKNENDATTDSIEEILETNRKEKRHSESTESSFPDISYFNDDMLNDLENMDIPVEGSCKKETTLDDELKDDDKNLHDEGEIKKESDKNLDQAEKSESNESQAPNIPLNLPRLTKRPKIKLEESPSIKSVSDETEFSSTSGQENIDTISDTNIKFISDDDIELITNNDIIKNESKDLKKEIDIEDVENKIIKKECNTDNFKGSNDKKEYITVYKIVSSDTQEKPSVNKFKNIPEYSSYVENLMKQESSEETKSNGQLNSFFKKCKFVNRKKKKELDSKEDETKESFCDSCKPSKCITVAQDENVKYCLNCSSIFDTEECSYC